MGQVEVVARKRAGGVGWGDATLAPNLVGVSCVFGGGRAAGVWLRGGARDGRGERGVGDHERDGRGDDGGDERRVVGGDERDELGRGERGDERGRDELGDRDEYGDGDERGGDGDER